MSYKIKKIQENMEEIKALLEATPMHQLLGKLEEYGAGDAFKHGKKKAEIIEDAIKILEQVQMKGAGAIEEVGTGTPVEAQVDILTQDQEQPSANTETPVVGSQEGSGTLLENVVKGSKETKEPIIASNEKIIDFTPLPKDEGESDPYDEEQAVKAHVENILKNIENCKLNLFNATEHQRDLLLKKIEELESQL